MVERHGGDVRGAVTPEGKEQREGWEGGVLTFLFEGEILCQMSTFMVSPQKKECLWVEDFQRPQVQHALEAERERDRRVRRSLAHRRPANWRQD